MDNRRIAKVTSALSAKSLLQFGFWGKDGRFRARRPATRAAVERFEAKFGRRVPASYREFLLTRANGGRPSSNELTVRFKTRRGWREGPLLIAEFARANDGPGYPLSLWNRVRSTSGRIPPDTLPIGDDLGGDPIYIYLRGPRRGEVCTAHVSGIASWHDFENNPDEAEGEQVIRKDFAEVIRALEANAKPEDTRPVEPDKERTRRGRRVAKKARGKKVRPKARALRFAAQLGPETVENVRAFERLHGVDLPADYRRFLRTVGGGRPNKIDLSISKAPRHDPYLSGIAIRDLHHLTRKGRSGSVVGAVQALRGLLPRGTLPIGRCADDSPILLYVSGRRRGQVWRWERKYVVKGKPDSGMTLLRGSFAKFVRGLSDWDRE